MFINGDRVRVLLVCSFVDQVGTVVGNIDGLFHPKDGTVWVEVADDLVEFSEEDLEIVK